MVTPRKVRRSPLWKLFTPINEYSAKCVICDNPYSIKGSINALRRHLESMHSGLPEVQKVIKQIGKTGTEAETEPQIQGAERKELQQQLYKADQQLEKGNLINIELERLKAIIDAKDSVEKIQKVELTKQFNEKELQQQLYNADQQLEKGNLINIELERLKAIIDAKDSVEKIQKAELTKQFNEKINSLECLLEEEREKASNEIANLKVEIETAKATVSKDVCSEDESLKDLVTSLKDELRELKEELAECKAINYNTERAKSQLIIKSKELEETLKITKEMLKSKTEILMSTIEELKKEKALLSSELAIWKAGPLDNKETVRQEIEKNENILHDQCLEGKKILAEKIINDTERLKAENRKIQTFWDDEVSNIKLREQKLSESYKQTIDELRSLNRKLELRPEFLEMITKSDNDLPNMQWIHTMLDKERAESRELRKAYEKKSCDMLLVEENLHAMSIEIKNLKKQAIKDKTLIDELQFQLNAFENPDKTIYL